MVNVTLHGMFHDQAAILLGSALSPTHCLSGKTSRINGHQNSPHELLLSSYDIEYSNLAGLLMSYLEP